MKTCIIEGCENYAKGRHCVMHYTRMRKTGTFELKPGYGEKRKHPLYVMWHDRVTTNSLCQEWYDDFWAFVAGVGEKPGPNYILVRYKPEPYGPDNFAWKETLKRKPGESKKDWYARKWASQQVLHPARERRRDLYRRFGLTIEEYDAMHAKQGGKCAICGKSETALDGKLGSPKRLAVDHCHATGKVRGLLCWNCNSGLGKVEDSIPTLKAMIAYLRRHE